MKSVRVLLNAPPGWIHLPPGEYSIGRADDCDVVLHNGRVSRRHARLLVNDQGAVLEDLASANGTWVNGIKVEGRVSLAHDDFIVVGEVGLEIAYRLPTEAVKAIPLPSRPEKGRPGLHLPSTSQTSTAEIFATALDYAMARRQPDQAERALEGWLMSVLESALDRKRIEEDVRDVALRSGIELASALAKGRWVDYTLELATATGVALTALQLRALDATIDRTGIDARILNAYSERLRALRPDALTDYALSRVESWRPKGRRRSSPPQ